MVRPILKYANIIWGSYYLIDLRNSMLSNQIDHQLCKSDYNTRLAELRLPSLHYQHQCGDMHRRWKVEKVWGAEHCRLRGLSLSRGFGGMPPGNF